MNPLAYEIIQRTRQAYIEAGPDGMCRGVPITLVAGRERRCAVGRMGPIFRDVITRERLSVTAETLLRREVTAAPQRAFGENWAWTNDEYGFDATVALFDAVLAHYAPAPGVEESEPVLGLA